MTNFNGFTFTNLSSGDTLSNPNTFLTPANAFDDNDITSSNLTILSTGTLITKTLGTTYASRTITVVRVKANLDMGLGSVSYAGSVILQGFNGTSWVDLVTLGTTITQTLVIDTLIRGSFLSQGLRLQFKATTDNGLSTIMTVSSLSYGTNYTYTPKPLLTALGGTNLENLNDRTAISEDHTLTWDKILNLGMSGIVVNAYRTLQANNIFTNGINLVTDEFLTASGTNGTVNTVGSIAPYNAGSFAYQVDLEVFTGNPFIIIEATSLNPSDFTINDCKCLKVGIGKWQLSCVLGTLEVRRAKIIKTLFFGTTGGDPRATPAYITGITAIKTNIPRDIGKQGHYATLLANAPYYGPYDGIYTGVFTNTTTNSSVSSWSNLSFGFNGGNSSFYIPTSILRHTLNGSSSLSNNEIGTDTSLDEVNNPANLKGAAFSGVQSSGATVVMLILANGSITWTASGSVPAVSNTDFLVTHGIPNFTATVETFVGNKVICDTNTLTLDGTETTAMILVDKSIPPIFGPGDGIVDINSVSSAGVVSLANYKIGYRLRAKENLLVKSVTKFPLCTATQCYLFDTSFNLLEQVAFIGNVATFINQHNFLTQDFIVETDALGANYNVDRLARAYPISSTTIDIINRVYNQVDDTTQDGYNIASIETETLTLMPGTASINIDLSDGTTSVLSQTINSKNLTNPIDVSSLGAGTYTISFNLVSTDGISTPLLKGYSTYIQ